MIRDDMRRLIAILAFVGATGAGAREYHVGADRPLKTISAAAELAQPGDTITVHAGIYRERVTPPRGGTSDKNRITYRAARGEQVVITGSEVVTNWVRVTNDTWKAVLPNAFFGVFNPYRDLIQGDWFDARGREHHTGAVYLDGKWLREAAKLDEVLAPPSNGGGNYLLNLAWVRVGSSASRVAADQFAAKQGSVRAADSSEGEPCMGWILSGDWIRYERVEFGQRAESVEIRAASATAGGKIELRDGAPDGELLGACVVAPTGDWQDWETFTARIKPTSGARQLCLVFKSTGPTSALLWFAQVDQDHTTIWAQLPETNPNEGRVEINVRKTVFTPEKTGIDYITVCGFTMRHAASNWAPPSAGQIGLVSACWCKGWIIESTDISYSKCAGVALGKYGDEFDNTNKSGAADPYTECVRRALTNGWNKATVGSHIVRNNHIHHCEQAGIVGSMGCAFSQIVGNEIHDIHTQGLLAGWELAGIKFHGAIDVVIKDNHVYRCHGCNGLWLDWMAQGTHVVGNLLHNNAGDTLCEVDHGPYLFANNLLLSPSGSYGSSDGGAYVHNLFVGPIAVVTSGGRRTPYFKPHTTDGMEVHTISLGDVRWFNNVLTGAHLGIYDKATTPVTMLGNVFLKSARPSLFETNALVQPHFDAGAKLERKSDGWYLILSEDKAWRDRVRHQLVSTELLGKAVVPNQAFEKPDGTPLRVDTDYFGKHRNEHNPFPGPFETPVVGEIKVWPKS